jgi:hypothetical protein
MTKKAVQLNHPSAWRNPETMSELDKARLLCELQLPGALPDIHPVVSDVIDAGIHRAGKRDLPEDEHLRLYKGFLWTLWKLGDAELKVDSYGQSCWMPTGKLVTQVSAKAAA